MFDHETWSAIFFLLATGINFVMLLYFFGMGALNIGEFFVGIMVWFYGTIIVTDHLYYNDDGDDNDYAE